MHDKEEKWFAWLALFFFFQKRMTTAHISITNNIVCVLLYEKFEGN